MDQRQRDNESRERRVQFRRMYLGGLAMLAVLIAGLAASGGLVYAVYRAFAGLFAHYDGP
jgi:hypothetical protein